LGGPRGRTCRPSVSRREGASHGFTQFALQSAADMLRAGVTFGRSSDDAVGIRIVLKDSGVVVDLTDESDVPFRLRQLWSLSLMIAANIGTP